MVTHPIKILVLFLLFATIAKAQHITLLQQGKPTSIRGLSIVDDKTAWISGSKGYIALTTDGGQTWAWQQVKGYENADFRSIEAFSDKEAIIMSSGTPALILKTVDGGTSWQLKYRNADTAYFLDAMAFANKQHGYVLGDPIKNKFLLLETQDGGNTWSTFKKQPDALPGEAAFAASGTCMRVDNNTIDIVTGGKYSRMLAYIDSENYWLSGTTGLTEGKPSQGAFSLANNTSTQIFVGGDYSNDKKTDSVATYIIYCCYANTINYAKTPPSGYQSCVEYINGSTFLSTGTPGSDITTDGGKTGYKLIIKALTFAAKQNKEN